ncbi:MAG: hypothetical protein LBE12_12155 [Planctomycetaceae bacterium]|nr:hypothetical protein [Planctomycetaceae bacterium]
MSIVSDKNYFPSSQWYKIAEHILWTNENFNKIGHGRVYVEKELNHEACGVNMPIMPGLSLASDTFWHNDPFYTQQFFLHESLHSRPPFIGHWHINGFMYSLYSVHSAYEDLKSFFLTTKSEYGQYLDSLIIQEAKRRNEN